MSLPDQPDADARTEMDLLKQYAEGGDDLKEFLARSWLAYALARRGHKKLAEADLADDVGTDQRAAAYGLLLLCWSLGSFIGVEASLWWPIWPALALGVLAVIGVLFLKFPRLATPLVFLLLLAWLITLAALLERHSGAVLATHIVPVVLVLVGGVVTRRVPLRDAQDVALSMAGVVRGAPLLAPLVLAFLFLPSLSSDVWSVANALSSGRLIGVAVVAVGVLLLVVRSQLRRELQVVMTQRAQALARSLTRAERTRYEGLQANPTGTKGIIGSYPDELLDSYWPPRAGDYVPYLAVSERNTLLGPLGFRLVLTTTVLGVVLTLYVYLLAAVTVSPHVATDWLGHPIPLHHVRLLLSITLPAGPYLRVSALLGIVATATFLGFAMIEERFASALTDALLGGPVDRLLVLALPYLALDEKQIEAELAARDTAVTSEAAAQ